MKCLLARQNPNLPETNRQKKFFECFTLKKFANVPIFDKKKLNLQNSRIFKHEVFARDWCVNVT